MTTNAVAGIGAEFRRATDSTYAAIAEVNTITGPNMSRTTIDVTSLDSVGGYMEFIGGQRDPGSIVLNMNFAREQYDLMKGDFESNSLVYYEIILPDTDNTTLEFQGLVTEIPLTVPPNDKITVDVTIKISGSVTVNSGSGRA